MEKVQKLISLSLITTIPVSKDYKQYSSGRFSGVKPACDPASLERAAREAEMRARDKFCPECGAQVWPVDGINVGVDRYHQVRHTRQLGQCDPLCFRHAWSAMSVDWVLRRALPWSWDQRTGWDTENLC